MQQTRRSFFAAIGAAVLGKYAVRFFPQMSVARSSDQSVLDYVTACHEQAAINFASYIDAVLSMRDPRHNAVIENIEAPQIRGDVGYYMGRPIRTNFDPARLPA